VDVPIQVVDSRTTAMALGFAALEAGRCAAAGYDALHVSDRAQQVAGSATALFLVDSLKHLRSGGRISAGAAAFGTALGMKPILHMQDGRIQLLQRARTKNVALDKMVATAASAATKLVNPVLAVHHFGAEQDAIDKLIQKLLEATGLTPTVSELSAVLGTHVGPGALAIVVADLGQHSHN
jgi:DegV family protein with EDD domain